MAFLHPDVDLTSRESLLSCKNKPKHLIKPCRSLSNGISVMWQLLPICGSDIRPRLSLSHLNLAFLSVLLKLQSSSHQSTARSHHVCIPITPFLLLQLNKYILLVFSFQAS